MGLDPDEYHNCRKVMGEGTMKLHDKINQQYDQQINVVTNNSNSDKLG